MSPYLLSGILTVTGIAHFVVPGPYERIIPPLLPAHRLLVYVSGAAELACAATLAPRVTRNRAAWATAGLFVAVFPANVYMAIQSGGGARWLALARLPLQVPLVWWALSLRDANRRRSERPIERGHRRTVGSDEVAHR